MKSNTPEEDDFITLEQARELFERGTPLDQVITMVTGCTPLPLPPEPAENITPESAEAELDEVMGYERPGDD